MFGMVGLYFCCCFSPVQGIRLFHTFHPLEADMGTHVIVYITD